MNARAEIERLRLDPRELSRIQDAVREAKALTAQLRSAEARRDVWEKRLRELDGLHDGDVEEDEDDGTGLAVQWGTRVATIRALRAQGKGIPELSAALYDAHEELESAEIEVDAAEAKIVIFVRQPDQRQAALMAEYRRKPRGWRTAWLVSLHLGLGFTKVMRLLPALKQAGLITEEPVVDERETAERRRRHQQKLRDDYEALGDLSEASRTLQWEGEEPHIEPIGNCGGGQTLKPLKRAG